LELGGNVRKGEHGTKVYFVKQLQIRDQGVDDEAATRLVPMLREYTVFNVDKCDKLPDRIITGKPMRVRNPDTRDDLADDFLHSIGADIREGQGEAYYVPSRDFISIPAFAGFKSADHFYNVVLHELIHWSGHKSRLDRDLKNRFGSKSYAAEELIAELGAAFLCAEFGFDGDVRNAGYIASWIDLLKAGKRAFFTACSQASKAADYLRGLAPSRQRGRRDGPASPTARAALRHQPADGHQLRGVLFGPHTGDVRQGRRWLVLVDAPTWLFTGWLGYRAVCHGLHGIS
jgi:antirestriction protein ArdC